MKELEKVVTKVRALQKQIKETEKEFDKLMPAELPYGFFEVECSSTGHDFAMEDGTYLVTGEFQGRMPERIESSSRHNIIYFTDGSSEDYSSEDWCYLFGSYQTLLCYEPLELAEFFIEHSNQKGN